MIKRSRKVASLAAAGLCLASGEGLAQVSERPEFGAALRLTQTHVDNAFGVRDDQDQEGEWQSEYAFLFSALMDREWLAFDADYEASYTEFDEDSQSEDSVLEGQSELTLGTPNSLGELRAGHSVRRFIEDPAVSSILRSNIQDRQITWLAPSLRTHLGRANTASLGYRYVDIRFDDDQQNNSQREALGLEFARQIRPTYGLAVSANHETVEFDRAEEANYDIASVQLAFSGASRLLEYRLAYGLSEVDPDEGSSYRSPVVDINLNSLIVGRELSLFYSRQVTDTSQGNANDSFFSENLSFDGLSGQESDQIEQTTAGFSWRQRFPCRRCETSLSIGFQDDQFVTLTENDSREEFVELQMQYRLSRDWSVQGSIREATTDLGGDRAETENSRWRAGITGRLNEAFALGIEFSESTQSTQDLEDISIGRIELNLLYTLN